MNINDNKLNELINKTEKHIQKKTRQRKLILSGTLGTFSIALAVVAISVIMNRQQVPDVVINNTSSINAASENIHTTTQTSMPTPTIILNSPTLSPSSSPVITSNESLFKYIDELDINNTFPTCFINSWIIEDVKQPFKMDGQVYLHGIGMFIPSKDIMETKGSKSLSWNLNGEFDKISFDLGCEQNFGYDVVEKFGSYIITIYSDDNVVFETERLDYTNVFNNLEIPLGDNCERLEIRFTQYKGELGTLNVVMGDFKLFNK